MISIRVKFDPRCQQFQLIESYNGHLFEEGVLPQIEMLPKSGSLPH